MSFGVLFPGQGSQFSGMGEELFDLRSDLLGERADRTLGWSLREMCLQAPEEELTRTEHAQPALFAVTYALWDELRARLRALPSAGAGHSLGEYTALAAAGVLTYDDALALVAERGRAMAAAADLEPSGMAALIGANEEAAEAVASTRRDQGGRLFVANVNAPSQVVLAGGVDDITWLEESARRLGLGRVVPLKVAGAFHSPFMETAAARLEEALRSVNLRPPAFPVYANVNACPIPDVSALAESLVAQVVSPVRFADSLFAMSRLGIGRFLHVGPGDVTAGLARRSIPEASTFAVSDLAGVDAACQWLGTIG